MIKKSNMTVSTLDLYNILRSKIGEMEAKTLVEFVEQKVHLQFDEEVCGLATKEDISLLKAEINAMEVKIEKTKAEIIKWMFIFWAGQTGIMVGILALFNK
jgi:hypothetical protein